MEEAIFIDIFTGRGDLKGQGMLISATPSFGNTVICRYPALPFRPLYNNMSLLSFLLFLRDSHFNCPRNASHTPSFIYIISGHKPNRTLSNLFLFFLKHISMRVPNRASITQDWTHHTFIGCFLLFGGRRKEFASRNQGFY